MMSSADLLEDGFPHGTPAGYDKGCQSAGGCPTGHEHGLSCKIAKMKSRSDYQYQQLVKRGATVPEIADALGLIGTAPVATAKPAKPKRKHPAEPTVDEQAVVDATAAADTHEGGEPEQPRDPEPTAPVGTTKEIRAWARERGYELADRGRIPQEIVDHYWEVHRGLNPTPTEAPAEPVADVLTQAREIRAAVGPLRNDDGTLNTSRVAEEATLRERAGLPAWIAELDAPPAGLIVLDPAVTTAGEGAMAIRPSWPAGSDYGTVNLKSDLDDATERVVELSQQLAALAVQRDESIRARDQARDLAARLEQELARLEQTRADESAAHAAARLDDANLLDQARIETQMLITTTEFNRGQMSVALAAASRAAGSAERALELVLQKWDEASRKASNADRALGYIDGSLNGVADLSPDLAWRNAEVVELLEEIRSLILTGAEIPGAFVEMRRAS